MLQLESKGAKLNLMEIYDRHHAEVRRFIFALVRDEWLADDLTQETLVRVQTHLDRIKDLSKLRSWMFRTAYNLCQDNFRQSRRFDSGEFLEEGHVESPREAGADRELEIREMGLCVQNQMASLPESQRVVLVLHDMMGLSHREIGETLGISVENAKVRLHRGRKRLKTILEQQCTFEKDERNVLVCEPSNG
jgi:RNA polymerase sigma-70 factor (ECF subfamily)